MCHVFWFCLSLRFVLVSSTFLRWDCGTVTIVWCFVYIWSYLSDNWNTTSLLQLCGVGMWLLFTSKKTVHNDKFKARKYSDNCTVIVLYIILRFRCSFPYINNVLYLHDILSSRCTYFIFTVYIFPDKILWKLSLTIQTVFHTCEFRPKSNKQFILIASVMQGRTREVDFFKPLVSLPVSCGPWTFVLYYILIFYIYGLFFPFTILLLVYLYHVSSTFKQVNKSKVGTKHQSMNVFDSVYSCSVWKKQIQSNLY